MKTPHRRLTAPSVVVCLAALTFLTSQQPTEAATAVWTAASGTDTNWSNGANWSGGSGTGGVPGSDDVKLDDLGSVATASNINNVVDLGFTGPIASLQYGNTNGTHTTLIPDGSILSLTGTGGLTVGTLTDNGNAQVVNATITGAGTLSINNPAANVVIDQGRASNGNGTQRATLDMTGLGLFSGNISAIAVGTTTLGGANNAQNATGTLKLAQTNVITTSFVGTPISANIATPTNAVQVGSDNGNAGGTDFLFLGQSNQFFIDSIGVGALKTTASMLFNPGWTSPVAYFRGTSGAGSRVRFWSVGDMASSGSSSAIANGTNDFSGGTVDILVDTMSLGRDRQGGNTGTTITRGTFIYTAGTLDANTIYVGNQQFPTVGNSNPMAGVLTVNGSTAVLKVNSVLYLGRTSVSSPSATNTTGILNATNSTLLLNNIFTGTNSTTGATTNRINLANATMWVTNAIATNGSGLFSLSISNSTLGLFVPTNGTLKGLVKTLNTVGDTNYIALDTTPVVFPVYPTNISLIRYTTWTGSNTFGVIDPPAWAPDASIVSNGPNSTVDLSLPTDPRPVITGQPSSYSGSPGDNVTTNFAVIVADGSGAALTYAWYYATPTSTNLLADGPGPGGTSTVANSTTANMTISGAQPGDNGTYFAVVTNIYGGVTSTPVVLNISAGCVGPQITGPNNQTIVEGNNVTFTASVSANPAAYIQWQRDGVDISGAHSSSITVNNVQYPEDDQAVFSIIATNDCGNVTNSAILTVIVPPAITNQPASLAVTNTQLASFTVVAGGVPTPAYQWNKGGLPISSLVNSTATNATFIITNASPADIGTYSVTVQNAANTVTSSNATLTVDSTMGVVSTTPANSASGICYDTPLTVVFSQAPALNNIGTIKIFNVNNPTTPVDTITLSLGNLQPRTVGGNSYNLYSVLITNNTAVIYPHNGVMTSNQTYYVTMDEGAFKDSAGAYFAGITATNAWQFTTKTTGPVDPVNPVVAADGSADFATVQGAVDSLPTAGPVRRTITVQNGTYVELVNIVKSNLTLRGQSRAGTVVGYANNNNNNPGTAIRMAFHVNSADVAVENMTVANFTPQGGSQAEAFMLDNNAVRFILNNAEVDSRQDTILINSGTSQAYFYNSLIQGNFDYIWGGGNLFVTNCEIRTIGGTGTPNLAAPRTANGATGNWPGYGGLMVSNGFSFVKCQLTRAPGVTNCLMSDHNGQQNGQAAWINCSIDLNCYTNADSTALGSQLLWEYGCSNLDNTIALDNTHSPFIGFTQLNNGDLALMAAQSATVWLNGWAPQLAPNILTNPASQTVVSGQSVTFTVGVTAVGDPAYQWLRNGTNIDGQTNASLVIPAAVVGDAGSYSVIVSNAAGTATSGAAVLTVNNNTAPTLTPVANQTVNVGVTVNVTNVATDPDVPPQTLTYSLLTGPGTLNASSGVFSWRPPVASSGTSNGIIVVVTDNGLPALSATNTFAVFVNPVSMPVATNSAYSNGQFSMTINGDAGPDYIIQVSTNLFDWQSVLTNGSPTLPFTFTDTNAAPVQFYRTLLGP